jgi:hypothetical protein
MVRLGIPDWLKGQDLGNDKDLGTGYELGSFSIQAQHLFHMITTCDIHEMQWN